MLGRILIRFLKPYRGLLAAVIVFQAAQTIASLILPSLNAQIIDQGIAKGDTATILRLGVVMLGITVVQIACSIVAVYFGARTAMAFGRDVRLAVFDRVRRVLPRFRGLPGHGLTLVVTRDWVSS